MPKFKHNENFHEENPNQKLLDEFVKKLKRNKEKKKKRGE